jgi:hypothetical protein
MIEPSILLRAWEGERRLVAAVAVDRVRPVTRVTVRAPGWTAKSSERSSLKHSATEDRGFRLVCRDSP